MRKVYKKREEEGVSPVIATILMVAITVVLAAVLYVMVIGMGGDGGTIETPLGLNQQGKNTTAVTLLVSSAPTDAMVTGTSVAVTRAGTPQAVTSVTVFDASASIIAEYSGGTWTYPGTATADTAAFRAGYSIQVYIAAAAAGETTISSGDRIVISSGEGNFGTTTFNVN